MYSIILQDPAYNTGKFGEIKELIIGMLENYNYEEVTLYASFTYALNLLIGVKAVQKTFLVHIFLTIIQKQMK